MLIKGRKIGIALTGSFCTYEKILPQIEKLVQEGADVTAVFSNAVQTIDCRFAVAEEFMKKIEEITGKKGIRTIAQAEPIGPKSLLDILVVLPCTGNSLAKIANGITDTPVLMAAKAHLRNDKPLVISLSTNDALGMNMKNIGLLLNTKNIYFIPFGQDDPIRKPNSMIAHTDLLIPTIEAALNKEQYQPVIRSPF